MATKKVTPKRKTPKLIGEGRHRLQPTSPAQAKADSERIFLSRVNKRILPKTHPEYASMAGLYKALDRPTPLDKRTWALPTDTAYSGGVVGRPKRAKNFTPSEAAETGMSGRLPRKAKVKVATGTGRTHMLSPKKEKKKIIPAIGKIKSAKQLPYKGRRQRVHPQSV